MGKASLLIQQLVCVPLKIYQYLISPLLKPNCRYYPSCSKYAETAIRHFGVIKGIGMALKRLLRCHPGQPGGYDPVLPKDEKH